MIDYYVDNVLNNLITSDAVDKEIIMKKFSENFKNLLEKIPITKRWNTISHILARKLVHESLSLRKKMDGEFMKTVRSIGSHLNTLNNSHYTMHTTFEVCSCKCKLLYLTF